MIDSIIGRGPDLVALLNQVPVVITLLGSGLIGIIFGLNIGVRLHEHAHRIAGRRHGFSGDIQYQYATRFQITPVGGSWGPRPYETILQLRRLPADTARSISRAPLIIFSIPVIIVVLNSTTELIARLPSVAQNVLVWSVIVLTYTAIPSSGDMSMADPDFRSIAYLDWRQQLRNHQVAEGIDRESIDHDVRYALEWRRQEVTSSNGE